jgi:amino acid transporter
MYFQHPLRVVFVSVWSVLTVNVIGINLILEYCNKVTVAKVLPLYLVVSISVACVSEMNTVHIDDSKTAYKAVHNINHP